MMVQIDRRNSSGVTQNENETARTDKVINALSGFEACLFSDADLEKKLNEALDDNKKKDATIMRLRDQIYRYQAQERSMEAKIIQLSLDLAMTKAAADRQKLKMLREQQQPQETLHVAEEANPFAPFASARRKSKTRDHCRSKSLNIHTNLAVEIVDVDEEIISNNIGSKVRHCLGNLDSSFRSLRQSVLMGSMNTDSEASEKTTKSLTGSMNTSLHSIVKDGEFDCDNNSRIDWEDEGFLM